MRVCIHRGTKQIGGTCIEVEAEGKRLVLDVGLPLDSDDSDAHLPPVKGFREADESLLAVVISHPHQDHYGLVKYVRPEVPIAIGEAASRILQASSLFTPSGHVFNRTIPLKDRQSLHIGPFEVTPYLVDHSAYDAYSLLISSGDRKLFYTGDFRAHGRKGKLFERLLQYHPKDVDVLLMEGTTIGRTEGNGEIQTESDLENEFVQHFKESNGMVLVWSSGQNIDRLVTVFRACKQTGRQLVIDLYTAEILRATGNPKIPQGTWDGVRVFLPQWQKRKVIREKLFELVNPYKANRIYPEGLAEEAIRSVMLVRPSMADDLEEAGCLEGASLVYSLWDGYLKDDSTRPFRDWLERHEIPITSIHTSGHASVADLKRLAKAIQAKKLVPIHTFESERYPELFENVEAKEDGVWWEI